MKILVVFTTIAKLVYRHEAVTKFSKLPGGNEIIKFALDLTVLTGSTSFTNDMFVLSRSTKIMYFFNQQVTDYKRLFGFLDILIGCSCYKTGLRIHSRGIFWPDFVPQICMMLHNYSQSCVIFYDLAYLHPVISKKKYLEFAPALARETILSNHLFQGAHFL